MLVFEKRGKPECPEKNLSVQSREPTKSTYIWRRVSESNSGHNGGRRVLSPLRHPCTPKIKTAKGQRVSDESVFLVLKWHLLWSWPLLKRWSFPITCRILSLLDRPQSALQAKDRIQSASTRGVFTINKDRRTLMPLLARTHPHILCKISSLLLKAGLDFDWNFATAPLNCNKIDN